MKNVTLAGAALILASALAACGGGGSGGGGGGGGIIPTIAPTATPTPSTTTTASGTVVDDTTGNPIAGVKVALRPWAACSTPTPTSVVCPTPLPAPQATTAANGTFTLTNAPNGHYFLVVGDDTPGSNVTTVHSNVTLSGGTVALTAPTLPPVPTVTPPAWEKGGAYRIQTLDATTMAPCFTEYNLQRTNYSLPHVVADEWLLENSRDNLTYKQSGSYTTPPWPGNANGGLADTYDFQVGGVNCNLMVDGAFGNAANPSRSALTIWYGGLYRADPNPLPPDYTGGDEQELADPATVPSTVGVVWP